MILTGSRISEEVAMGKIVIDPFYFDRINPNSYDLTLSDRLLRYDEVSLDMAQEPRTYEVTIPPEGYWLHPNDVYLACTVERCGSARYVTCLEGRSSIGRLGMQVHLTAGFGDLGFVSRWTLEISVIKPLRIYAGVRICQAVFFDVLGERDRLYGGKYVEQTGPVPSRMWRDKFFERREA